MNPKPTVVFFSDANSFSLSLLETLLAKSCEVTIVASNLKDWLTKTNHIANKTSLHFAAERNFFPAFPITYAVFCLGFLEKKNSYARFNSLYRQDFFARVKSMVIFPAEVFDLSQNSTLPLNSNLAVVYLGDLLGPRMDLTSPLRLNKILQEVLANGSVTVGVGEVFYPLFAPAAAKQVCRWIFSFGPYGKEIFLTGGEVSAAEFWKETAKIFPTVKLYYDKKIHPFVFPQGFAREVANTNLPFALRETFNYLLQEKAPVQKPNKLLKGFLVILVFFFLFPVFNLLASAGLLYVSYSSYLSGRADLARNLLISSRLPAAVGKGFAFYSGDLGYGFYLVEEIANAGLAGLEATETAQEFITKILGNEIYNPENLAQNLDSSLQRLYQSVSRLEYQTKHRNWGWGAIATQVKRRVNFEKSKKLISFAAAISQELPKTLGSEQKQAYLLLLQNNMEIRPTGGFIGSFALVTFEGGRMVDFSVSDIYSADGQLKGHVEPPAPLKKYLGEASWFLRDSNWDPDFPTSAKRAEWFIDKEIDRSVDGVIGIDLYPVKDILAITGPIYLADYDMEISSANLYERTQAEVEENFFPGTQKKTSFLTALSRNLIGQLVEQNTRRKTEILKIFLENLEKRHIQVFLHNQKVQSQISEMGWAGEVKRVNCGEECYADFFGLVEANVGVNKANYFVERHQRLTVNVLPERIERELVLTFKNSANLALGPRANYKSYVRLLIPADAQVAGNFEVTESRGLKEVGFLLEVPPQTSQEVVFTWVSPVAAERYGIFVRKQAGTDERGNLSVVINQKLQYNSTLATDLWIPKP